MDREGHQEPNRDEQRKVNFRKKVSFEEKDIPRRENHLRGDPIKDQKDPNNPGSYSLDNAQKNDKKSFRIVGARIKRGPGGRFVNNGVGGINSRSMGFSNFDTGEIENPRSVEILRSKEKSNFSKFEYPKKRFSRTKSPRRKLNMVEANRLPMAIKPLDSMNKILSYDYRSYKKIIKRKERERKKYSGTVDGQGLPKKHLNLRDYADSARKNEYIEILNRNKGTQKLLQNSSYNNMFQDYEKSRDNEKIRKKYLYNLKKINITQNRISTSYDGYNAAGISSHSYERPYLRYFNPNNLKNRNQNKKILNKKTLEVDDITIRDAN